MKFDGDIICKSEPGKGSNFIFIVALEENSNPTAPDNSSLANRILNPQARTHIKFIQEQINWLRDKNPSLFESLNQSCMDDDVQNILDENKQQNVEMAQVEADAPVSSMRNELHDLEVIFSDRNT